MRLAAMLTIALLLLLISACGGGADSVSDVPAGQPDAVAVDVADTASVDTGGEDLAVEDVEGEDTPALPETRTWTYRAIGGVSMGATAFSLHTRVPGTFDFVAALGGYINPVYRQAMMKRHLWGGGCPLETLQEHIDEIDDPDSDWLSCAMIPTISPWEFAMDFNHWKGDKSGGTWDRDHYLIATQGLFLSLGNFLSCNPDHPLLPPGVPVSWAAPGDTAERCDKPVAIGKPWNYNLEYNPDGEHDLVTFCDGVASIPGGSDNPAFYDLAGDYDPEHDHDIPVLTVVAVDLNGNGRRDYYEPVVSQNNMERFLDIGTDGCSDGQEDGSGGCSGGGNGDDPNGDNFHVPDNPRGTEGDGWRQEGEPYDDDGLDGVAGTDDHGEGDGGWTVNPNLLYAMEQTPCDWLETAPLNDILTADYLLDGGIRDALGASVGLYLYADQLASRGVDLGHFDNYTGSPGAIFPSNGPTDFLAHSEELDLGPDHLGRSFMVAYGNPDATPEEIEAGDGKHVGTGGQMANRLAGYILTALFRWPDLETEPCLGDMGQTVPSTFYSPANQNRFNYAYSTPPCYDQDPEQRYPLIMLLAGHGSAPSEGMATALVFNLMVMNGKAPGFVMAIPDTACCYREVASGARHCACSEDPEDKAVMNCVDPACTGAHEDCDVLPFTMDELAQECFRGHFYGNLQSDKWGDLEAAELMRYEDMIFDLLAHMEAGFRLLDPVERPR